MAQFPTIEPSEISFDLGGMNVSSQDTASTGPVLFRHSLSASNYEITANFDNLTDSQVKEIRDHYLGQGGSALSFLAPSTLWGGLDVVPVSATYRYLSAPSENHGGIYNSISVSLSIIAGDNYLFLLIGEPAALGSEEAFSSYAFNGTAPFILDSDDASPATAATDTINAGGAAS